MRKLIWIVLFLLAFLPPVVSAGTRPAEGVDGLRQKLDELQQAGQLAEAVPVAARLTDAVRIKFGYQSGEYAAVLARQAALLQALGRYREAERYLTRARDVAVVAIGPDDPSTSFILNDLAVLYKQLGNFDKSEALFRQALAIREKSFGPDHPAVAHLISNMAAMYVAQGRFGEAEVLLSRANAISDKSLKPDDPEVARNLNNLATLLWTLGRYAEAEPLYKRALTLAQSSGNETPNLAANLNNLAQLYLDQGRFEDAEPLFRRALALRQKLLTDGHPDIAVSMNNLAWLLHQQRRYREALPLYEAALIIFKRLGAEHAAVGSSLNNVALLHHEEGRDAVAVPLFERAIAIRSKALGNANAEVGQSHDKMALALQALGRFDEARKHLRIALDIRQKALGADHPDVIQTLDDMAALDEATGRPGEAMSALLLAREAIVRRARHGTAGYGSAELSDGRDEIAQARQVFVRLMRVAWRLGAENPKKLDEMTEIGFNAAQWALQTLAEQALTQMSARQARAGGNIAALIRERQDLAVEWRGLDKRRNLALIQPAAQRNAASEQQVRGRLASLDDRTAAIDSQLKADFPDYFAYTKPEPSIPAAVQAQLHDDEALILLVDTPDARPAPEETFVFVVSRSEVRWLRATLGSAALKREVTALRCGLDYASAWAVAGSQCGRLTGASYTRKDYFSGKPLPFDPARAFALYQSLFGPAEDLIAGKHLLIVPSGALSQLPLHVLVTANPDTGLPADYRKVAWLARSHAITTLPAVSSLKALRQNARPSAAKQPFIGFGDPVLSGGPGCGDVSIPDRCPDEEIEVSAVVPGATRSIGAISETQSYFRDGLANVAAVRQLCPLPETAHELRCVARSLDAGPGSIVLGVDMTESALKKAPLNTYRVIHFATHGLLAGQTAKLSNAHAEPALVMTPPAVASDDDDGLLTASEVAGLKLDADLVVMSACNTAGGGAQGAEPLSGLARAFFYAGARALLVSHWPVDSYAATVLTTRTFAELRKDHSIGRSEALRRAMLALQDDPARQWAAHPSKWGPFVVVGEGSAAR